ncbi:mitofilin family membrane protein [Glycocaulis sp.]|uniref:COG4223 family protein n=1 Tax=Glycocaulis sp. TaxID=1969725 RepID=UPI003D239532
MHADSPENTPPPGEAEPIDAEFEPAKPEKRSGGGKAAMRLAGFVLALVLAGGAGGVAGWFAAGLNATDDAGASAEIARLESQLAGLDARLNAAEDRPLTEMVPTEALRTFDSEIRALEERVEAVEARPAGEAGASLDEAALEALLDEREGGLRAEIDVLRSAIENRPVAGGGAADLGPLEEALRTLEARLSAQDGRMDTELAAVEDRQSEAYRQLSRATSEAIDAAESRLSARLDALEVRLSEAEASAGGEAEAVERSAARILAFTALREAAQSSESFEAERANMARLWPNAPGLAALQPHARRGVPSSDELAESFPAAAIRSASGETRRFLGLFEIRPADTSPDSALALVGQAENRLARGDLSGAVEAAGRLEGPAAEAASDWLVRARARLEIEAALITLRNALSSASAPGRSTP